MSTAIKLCPYTRMSRSHWYAICSDTLNPKPYNPIASLEALATSTNAAGPPKDFLLIAVFAFFLLLIKRLESDRNTVLPLRIRVTMCKGVPFEAPTPPRVLGPWQVPKYRGVGLMGDSWYGSALVGGSLTSWTLLTWSMLGVTSKPSMLASFTLRSTTSTFSSPLSKSARLFT